MKNFGVKKYLVILFLGLYFLLNVISFGNISVCLAKDHIGIDVLGIDSCCFSEHNGAIFDKNIDYMFDNCDNCVDLHIKTGINPQETSINSSNILPGIDNINFLIMPIVIAFEEKYDKIHWDIYKIPDKRTTFLNTEILII